MLAIKGNNIIKCGRYILYLIGSIVVGTICLVVAFTIPGEKIVTHATDSAKILYEESNYPNWAPNYVSGMLDNYTDATMISGASFNEDNYSLIEKVMYVPREDYKNTLRVEALAYSLGIKSTNAKKYINIYPRYWHGYLIFLKPLLYFFDISQIRLLMMCLVCILTGVTCVIVYQKLGILYLLGLLCAVIIINPVTVSLSMQFLNVFIISLTTIDLLLLIPERNEQLVGFAFFFAGVAVAYFDFLTYPITALGLPLCVYLASTHKKKFLVEIVDMIKNALKWCFGYIGMWTGKWIIAYLLTGFNAIKDGIDRIQFHSEANNLDIYGKPISSIEAIQMNFNVLKMPALFLVVTLVLFIFIVLLIRGKLRFSPNKGKFFLFLIIGQIPFIWYFAVKNHSYVHFWFTYRSLSIWVLSIIFALSSLFKTTNHLVQTKQLFSTKPLKEDLIND